MIGRYCTVALFAALVAVQRGAAAATGSAQVDPDRIFRESRAAVNRLPQPPYIAFTFENQGFTYMNHHQGIARRGELLRVLVRARDGVAVVVALKDETGSDVPHPSAGIATSAKDWGMVSNITRLGDFPLDDFGLRYGTPARPGFFQASEPSPEASPLPVIATVVAVQPLPYRITDLGDDAIEGRPVYHLGLDPTRDPRRNVLRQIWIDKATLLPCAMSRCERYRLPRRT